MFIAGWCVRMGGGLYFALSPRRKRCRSKGAADGDSGAPVLIKVDGILELAGIVSRKYATRELAQFHCCSYRQLTHQVRISRHAPWIDGIISREPNTSARCDFATMTYSHSIRAAGPDASIPADLTCALLRADLGSARLSGWKDHSFTGVFVLRISPTTRLTTLSINKETIPSRSLHVSPLVHGAEMRIAETRAVNRALRKAYGIGICSVEEPGTRSEPVDNNGQPKKRPRQPENGNGFASPARLRDRLCQLIRQHRLDAALVKSYAVDFCRVGALKDAKREQVEAFVEHLSEWAAKDRNALLCQLNSYLPAKGSAA
jgi:hypothetical protein